MVVIFVRVPLGDVTSICYKKKEGKIRIINLFVFEMRKIFFFFFLQQRGKKIQFINYSHSFERFGDFKYFDRIIISSSNFSCKKIEN